MITEELTSPSSGSESEAPAAPKPFREPFNWETAGKSGDSYSAEERQRLEKMYDTTMNSVAEHEIVDGTVVAISAKDVLINIGYKSDGLIPLSEFRHFPDLKAG